MKFLETYTITEISIGAYNITEKSMGLHRNYLGLTSLLEYLLAYTVTI